MTTIYNIQDDEKVPVILNWLGRKGLLFVQTLNVEKQENVKAACAE